MDIYAVGQVARYLRESLESDDFLADLWVSGELSNLSRSAAGHLYFTLKDATSQLRCVMFRSALNAGGPALSGAPGNNGGRGVADGAAVVVHGRIAFYEARGDLQLMADVLMPQGAGALYLEFQRLKAKLAEEGLFDESRKRPVPAFPRRIAVVTSPTGAVLHDILNIIGRRYPLVELLVTPVPVQGDRAAEAIAAAFRTLNRRGDVDLVILARGGGSLEELWPFNEEQVVRAVFSSRAPVISAVGHETDYTLVDYVADLRAPTPSAAAELAVPDRRELVLRLEHFRASLGSAVGDVVGGYREEVSQSLRRFALARPDVARERLRLDDRTRTAVACVQGLLAGHRAALGRHLATLGALDPQGTLERGYAIVRREATGAVVSRRGQVAPGDVLSVRVSDGSFGARADGVAPTRSRKTGRQAQEQLVLFNR
ncbi:MAG: exodeoxyribonuclease VII large subunit [Chloroflexi bacterium]|nr:exodeoxyribonuclease VII large subunit [Chloroflexota bacterium]